MYSEKRLKKKTEEIKKKENMTPEEKREQEIKDNIKNGVLLAILFISFAIVIFMSKKMQKEISDYEASLYVEKDISDVLNKIEPLYPDKSDTEIKDVKVEDEEIYQLAADNVYKNLDKYLNKYENIYDEFNLEDINYIKIKYTSSSGTNYYYIINNIVYVSRYNIYVDETNISSLTQINNDVEKILDLIKIDIPTKVEDYLDYVIELEYYRLYNNLEFDIDGRVFLKDSSEKHLSLKHFVTLSTLLNKK